MQWKLADNVVGIGQTNASIMNCIPTTYITATYSDESHYFYFLRTQTWYLLHYSHIKFKMKNVMAVHLSLALCSRALSFLNVWQLSNAYGTTLVSFYPVPQINY
jgi:hypothetical protein